MDFINRVEALERSSLFHMSITVIKSRLIAENCILKILLILSMHKDNKGDSPLVNWTNDISNPRDRLGQPIPLGCAKHQCRSDALFVLASQSNKQQTV